MISLLFAIIGICCYFGIQNSANAVPSNVTFNPVAIRNGAILHVNSNNSLTAVDGGNKLVADNTSSNSVRGSGITNAVNNFASSNYGSDALFSGNATSNARLMSEDDLKSLSEYIPSVTSEYWLSNTPNFFGFGIRSYSTENNSFAKNDLKVSGKYSNSPFENWTVASGPYAFSENATTDDFYMMARSGRWELFGNMTQYLGVYYTDIDKGSLLDLGDNIYNNPFGYESGTDGAGNEYKKSVLTKNFEAGYNAHNSVIGIVSNNHYNYIELPSTGYWVQKNYMLVWAFEDNGMISDTTGFKSFTIADVTTLTSKKYYVGFYRAKNLKQIKRSTGQTIPIYGFTWFNGIDNGYDVSGQSISASSKSVRPQYNLSRNNIAFMRPSSSNATLATSSKFGDLPVSVAVWGQNAKAVVKSGSTTISNSISDSRLSITGSSSPASYSSSSATITVPYGAKTLNISSSALPTTNANYISAIANNSTGTKHYTVLGKSGDGVTIDLTSLLNTIELGSTATVSLYAEKANAENTSDVISQNCVTFDIVVGQGASQRITYSKGDGTGTVPSSANVNEGKSYVFADGSGLTKEGNPFSAWKLTYTKFGDTNSTTRYVKSNESLIIPNITGGISAVAMFSGIKATKTTESTPTVMTITWDANEPTGYDTKFTGDPVPGKVAFSDDMLKRFDKAMKNGEVDVPGALTATPSTKTFDGWWTAKEGGTEVTGKVVADVNKTYYAHWIDGYTVTYDASGGNDAIYKGKFSADGSTTDSEVVIPSGKTTGPKSSKGSPTPNDASNYMFYGWYTSPNGEGNYIDPSAGITINSNTTYYAYYDQNNTFLASATDSATSNPRNITGQKYSIKKVKSDAESIKTNSNYNTSIYNATNDSYHLYTRLKSGNEFLDADTINSWAEFRIIGVGSSSDSKGLTFQMVHCLPDTYMFNSNSGGICDWGNSSLRSSMQENGTIYNMFDSKLTNSIAATTRKYNIGGDANATVYSNIDKFTILSVTEYGLRQVANFEPNDFGYFYPFWNTTNNSSSVKNTDKYYSLSKTRGGFSYTSSWTRCAAIINDFFTGSISSTTVYLTYDNKVCDSWDGGNIVSSKGVVPCFSL